MSLRTVREALQKPIKEHLPSFRVYPDVRSVITTPAIVISPDVESQQICADYYGNGFGGVKWNLDLLVLLSSNEFTQVQALLDKLVSPDEPTSIPAILDSQRNGDIYDSLDYVKIKSMKYYGGEYVSAEATYIGTCFKLEIGETCA